MLMRSIVMVLAGVLVLGTWLSRADAGQAMVDVTLPALSKAAQAGQAAYAKKCAECHGENGAGNDAKGPPLIHRYYEPSHHADYAFLRAIRRGARAHHWRFGDMEPTPGVSDEEAQAIIRFVREVQKANGIE